MQHTASAAAEIDITSMQSSVFTDQFLPRRRIVSKSVDYAISDPGELSCEFYGPGGFNYTLLGQQRSLSVPGLPGGGVIPAFLTQISTQIVAGELVKGSCTFKLSAT
jgi:hypothetical protein